MRDAIKKVDKQKIAEVVVISFFICYGLNCFGKFFRKYFFDFTNSLPIDVSAGRLFLYLGHIIFLAFMLLYALAVKKDRKYVLSFLPKAGNNKVRYLLLGLLVGFSMNAFCILLASLKGDISIQTVGQINLPILLLAIPAVFLQSSVEEIESRGLLFGRMIGGGVPVAVASVVSGFFFSFLHAANPGFTIIPFINIFLVGITYALFYYYFGSLWFICAIHTAWNYTQDFIFGLPNSGNESVVSFMNTTVNGSSFFYDPTFGVEGSLVCTALHIVVCALVIFFGIRKQKQKGLRIA